MFSKTALKAAVDRAETLLGERAKVRAAMVKTTDGLAAAEQEAQSALSNLAAVEADNVLLTSDAPADGKASGIQRKALAVARETLETLRARLSGLQVRLEANRAALREAQADLDRARSEAGAERLADVKSKIVSTAETLRSLLLECLAVDQSFNGNGGSVHRWASSANLLSEDLSRNLLGTNPGNDGSAPWGQGTRLAGLAVPEHAEIAARIEKELAQGDSLQIVPRTIERAA